MITTCGVAENKERHAIRSEDEELVFLAFLHGAPLAA
jgi:hypothetical protein